MLQAITLNPGKEWPADLYTHPDCMNLDRNRDYGEDFLDLFAGCVLGALEQGDTALAERIIRSSNATASEKALVRGKVVELVGADVANLIFNVGSVPWYKNWKIMVPLGAGALLLGGVTVWAVRRRHKRS